MQAQIDSKRAQAEGLRQPFDWETEQERKKREELYRKSYNDAGLRISEYFGAIYVAKIDEDAMPDPQIVSK